MGRRIKAAVGDLFLVPRKDGQWVLGQVVEEWMKGAICVAIFDFVVSDKMGPISIDSQHPALMALPSVAKSELTHKHWPVVGNAHVLVDVTLASHHKFKNQNYNGAVWHSGGMVEKLVDAYYGLATWEPYPGRPGQLRSLLINAHEDFH